MTEEERARLLERRTAARKKLIDRLDDEGSERWAIKLEKCGQPIRLKCCDCRAQRTALSRCDLKWCPSCAPRIAHDRTKRFEPVVAEFIAPMFVTFTTRNFTARDKQTGMRHVRRSFTRLRAQRWWKRSVRGGVAAFEMTRKAKGWHPHVHAILDSTWFAATVTAPPRGSTKEVFQHRCKMACEEIGDQWTLALGGRRGTVHVRRISVRAGRSLADAVRECLKYSVTEESLDRIEGPLTPFLDELALTRNLVSFGSAYRHPALKKPKRDSQPCDCCGAFGTFLPAEIVEAKQRKKR